jgi:squalene cyclase
MHQFSLKRGAKSEKDLTESFLSLQRGVFALISVVKDFLRKEIELERTCRVALLLCRSGVDSNVSIFQYLAKKCASEQKGDGGWLGVTDTLWCASFLSLYGDYSESVQKALTWLDKQKHDDGSWGRFKRDKGRIPITGLILSFLPQLASQSSLEWLEREWEREREIEPKLTYKAAFTLMAFKANAYQPSDEALIPQAMEWLANQQSDDFGWGPCKNHPVGSTPFCTGLALLGLLQYPEYISRDVFRKGLVWLVQNQLPEGLWADHYIEEGSSWAFYALSQVLTYLNHLEG